MAHQALLGFASAVVDSGLDLQDDIWAARTPLFETLFGLAVRVLDERTPVSYTHLRAHETVLDLVCRLLLEKKKPTTISSVIRQPKSQTIADLIRHHNNSIT